MRLAEMSRIQSNSSANFAAHVAFVPIGIVTVLLGPLLPILSARWLLNYLQAGSLFTAQFLGSTLGVSLSGIFVSRWGFRFTISAGLLATAVGVGALPSSSHFAGPICIACYGAGLGLAIPACNLLVAAINPERRSAAINLLNFWWSAGAVACPFIVALAAKVNHIQLLLVLIAGLLLLAFSFVVATPASIVPATVRRDFAYYSSSSNWSWRSLFVLGALFFLYVGTENAFGGWIASYAKSLRNSSPTWSVMTPSFFFATLMIGRWIANFTLKKMDEMTMARVGLFVAFLAMLGLVFSRTFPLVVTSVSLAGVGLAAVYPITISRLSQEFGAEAARVGSFMFTLTNLGGAILPWTVGYASHEFHSLRIGLAVPAAATGLMWILYLPHPANVSPAR
jgi:FHS family glucose/mannose:H+ symporter-like MFS transporter